MMFASKEAVIDLITFMLLQTQEELMTTFPTIHSNDVLYAVQQEIRKLIVWAEADAEHSRESDAPGQAATDASRAKMLAKANTLLDACYR